MCQANENLATFLIASEHPHIVEERTVGF